AHLRRDFAAGQHLVAEVNRGPVGMALQRGDEEIGEKRGFVEVVGHGLCPTACRRAGSKSGTRLRTAFAPRRWAPNPTHASALVTTGGFARAFVARRPSESWTH